jgi:hypothetical protein
MAPRDQEPENLWTVAFDGPGDITEENAAALLDRELPQDIEAIYIPERISRKQRGLRVVSNWLTDIFGESGVQKTDNILASLSKGDTPVLIWLRGEEDTKEDRAALSAALDDDVHVLDLSQGLDDIDFDPEDWKETEEPVAEPEQPAPARTRKPRAPRTTASAGPAPVTTTPRGRTRATRPTPHPASQSTGPNGEDELAPRRRGTPRKAAVVEPESADTGAVADAGQIEGLPSTPEELNEYIDQRIRRAFHAAELAQ